MAAAFVAAVLALGSLMGDASATVSIPAPRRGAVSDYAGVILNEDARAIESLAVTVRDRCGVALAVATIRSLEGEPIEALAARWGAAWNVGEAEGGRGILLIVSVAERRARIEVGAGLTGLLSRTRTEAILEEEGAPYFLRGDYSVGIRLTVEAIARAAALDRGVDLGDALSRPLPRSVVSGGVQLLVILGSILLVAAGGPALVWWLLLRGRAAGPEAPR